MFQQRDIITAVELGTSKICVLVGEARSDGRLNVIGHGEVASENAVVKGEIADMDTALELLTTAIEEADSSSGREINNSSMIAVSVTGANINSYQGAGTVFVRSEDRRISDLEINEALQNAQVKPLPFEQTIVNTFDSYFLLDGTRRVRNPLDQVADKLEAHIHVIHGESNRVENFRSIMRDAGFDDEVVPVFNGIASVYGILTEEEKETGVLLVDMGAGTTEYIAVFNMGVLASGVIPIGFEHVANDLSLGLDLHISVCRKMIQDGTIVEHMRDRKGFIELKTSAGNIRKIPLSSLEKIIDMRLRETFQIIHKKITGQGIFRNLSSGGVLTGGGSMFPRTSEIYREVFQFPVRNAQPFDASGAVTGLENPRYSTVWGTLKFGDELNRILKSRNKRGVFGVFVDGMDGVVDVVWRTLSDLKNSIKI
jgi:cell division protein FtsA